METFTKKEDQSKEHAKDFMVEVLNDGDVYVFSAPGKKAILNLVEKIAKAFGEPEHEIKEIVADVGSFHDIRIQGNFNLKIDFKGRLVFDNRNGRGIEEYRKIMKKIVDSL